MINVGLIGYGRMGRKYFNFLHKNRDFKLVKILRKKKVKKGQSLFLNSSHDFFNQNYIDLYIVASPVKTHFKYFKKVLAEKKSLILEKPLVADKSELQKIITFKSKIKNNLLIHHGDLYNPAYLKFKNKLKKIGHFKNIKMTYGKYQKIYKNKMSPFFDWFPHPLATSIDILGVPSKIKILKNEFFKINKFFFQKLIIKFYLKKKTVYIHFSNSLKSPKRRIEIKGDRGTIIFDGYQKKSLWYVKNSKKQIIKYKEMHSIENMLSQLKVKFKKRNKINDINISIKVMKTLFKIQQKIL